MSSSERSWEGSSGAQESEGGLLLGKEAGPFVCSQVGHTKFHADIDVGS